MLAFTADNHIGVKSQWSIAERGNDFMSSFHDMVDTILHCCDQEKTLIIGGDLFDTAYPPSFAVEFVQREVQRLHNGGCRVFGIDGNHDIADGKWLRVCGIEPLSSDPAYVQHGVSACGIPYKRSSEVISEISAMADRGVKCNILVLHLAFGELNRMGAASDIVAADIMPHLKEMGVKLVLMGHIHIRQSVVVDGVTFAYCGSTERCSLNEPAAKSFDLVDGLTFGLLPIGINTRQIAQTVIGSEKEFAAYEALVVKDSPVLQALFITPDIKDGVKRLRTIAKDNNLLMRVQIIHPHNTEEEKTAIDRTTGIIGLEQAIELSFKSDSKEAELIRAILRSPETMKLTVENFIKEESK